MVDFKLELPKGYEIIRNHSIVSGALWKISTFSHIEFIACWNNYSDNFYETLKYYSHMISALVQNRIRIGI